MDHLKDLVKAGVVPVRHPVPLRDLFADSCLCKDILIQEVKVLVKVELGDRLRLKRLSASQADQVAWSWIELAQLHQCLCGFPIEALADQAVLRLSLRVFAPIDQHQELGQAWL